MAGKKLNAAQALLRELGYVSETDMAGVAGVTVPTLRNRASSGTLPRRYKLGSKSVYKLSEIEQWIARRGVDRGVAREPRAAA